MVALRHGNSGSNTLLLRFPCIKSVMVDGMYTMASGVTHRCLDITRGLHEFSKTGNFEMSLQLWFEAEMKLKVVYSKEPILNGTVWQISLAATCGKYGNQNTEPLLHEFCEVYDQPVTVSSLTLARNANMIPKSEVCRIVGILDCTDRVIPDYEYQSMPMHVKRLYELYSKLNDSGKVNIQGLLDVKVEDILDTLDAIDNVEVLPDITKASIRVGLELNLGSVDRNQFCIDVDALVDATPGNTFTVQAKRFHHMQLLCLSGHEFGELVSNVTKVMRLCLPRKIKPVTSSRLTTINTMERLTHYAIQCSVERVMQHRDVTPPMVNVLKIFTTQFPLWILSYLTDMLSAVRHE
uniref:Transcriptional regulator, Sir2 family domain containing protein n=1 Tax=Babesia bovis TaxID=5865 RepID=S6BFH1_BABBO|nr:transcriptional regulator, Sir2 family domain containing protein [Babesia bovis]